jgi:L-cystine transport system permease protein
MINFKVSYFFQYIRRILTAMPTTLTLTVFALFFGLLIGALLCLAGLSKHRVLNRVSGVYITFMRGAPQLVLIFLFYLGLPQLMKKIGVDMSGIDRMAYLVGIFSLAVSAPISELMRSAYLAVDRGQGEAALSVGMGGFAAFRRIVFPQALGIALPGLGNTVIMLFKMTSLGFSIGIVDLMGRARLISNQGLGTRRLEAYLAAACIYWGSCVVLEQGNKLLLRWYSKGRDNP